MNRDALARALYLAHVRKMDLFPWDPMTDEQRWDEGIANKEPWLRRADNLINIMEEQNNE